MQKHQVKCDKSKLFFLLHHFKSFRVQNDPDFKGIKYCKNDNDLDITYLIIFQLNKLTLEQRRCQCVYFAG